MKINCAHDELSEIPGFSKYLASTDGRIISKTNGLPIKQKFRKDGYIDVLVSPDAGPKYKLQLEHRLVCMAFHGKSNLCVNHKNGIKDDNNPQNLEWVTHRQNILHSMNTLNNKYGKKGFENNNSKINIKQHKQIVNWHKKGVLDKNQLALFFNVNTETIMTHIRKSKSIENAYGN